MELFRKTIPTPAVSTLAHAVQGQASALWLDSAALDHPRSRHSLLVLDPLAVLTISAAGEGRLESGAQPLTLSDPWDFLDRWLGRIAAMGAVPEAFRGGIAGFLSYESYGERERQQPRARHPWVPDALFLLFDSGLCIDGVTGQAELFSLGLTTLEGPADLALAKDRVARLEEKLQKPIPAISIESAQGQGQEIPDGTEYRAKVETIRQAIFRGDCYQVNFAQPFRFQGDWQAADLFLHFRRLAPAPQMAFIQAGDFQILSGSPETLLELTGSRLRSYPIKGTRPRGTDPVSDQAQLQALLASEKDQAELLMIVDLMRNDLGRCCEIGSVHVPELRGIETFPQVHHAVACIEGRLRSEFSPLQALRLLSPGGSVTGAPKLKAMEMINQLEVAPRGVYTGSVGFVDFAGNANFNLCIRTAMRRGKELEYWAGGGIVADSDPEAEYKECLAKARGFCAALAMELP